MFKRYTIIFTVPHSKNLAILRVVQCISLDQSIFHENVHLIILSKISRNVSDSHLIGIIYIDDKRAELFLKELVKCYLKNFKTKMHLVFLIKYKIRIYHISYKFPRRYYIETDIEKLFITKYMDFLMSKYTVTEIKNSPKDSFVYIIFNAKETSSCLNVLFTKL